MASCSYLIHISTNSQADHSSSQTKRTSLSHILSTSTHTYESSRLPKRKLSSLHKPRLDTWDFFIVISLLIALFNKFIDGAHLSDQSTPPSNTCYHRFSFWWFSRLGTEDLYPWLTWRLSLSCSPWLSSERGLVMGVASQRLVQKVKGHARYAPSTLQNEVEVHV